MIEGYRVVLTQREAYWIGAVTADPKNRRYLRIRRRLFIRRLRRSGYLAGSWRYLDHYHGVLELVCRNAQASRIQALAKAFGLTGWNDRILLCRGVTLYPSALWAVNLTVIQLEDYTCDFRRVCSRYGITW